MITVNGTQKEGAGLSVAELLEQEGYAAALVAVERNEQLVPRKEYAGTLLQEGDRVEIVRFVGGG